MHLLFYLLRYSNKQRPQWLDNTRRIILIVLSFFQVIFSHCAAKWTAMRYIREDKLTCDELETEAGMSLSIQGCCRLVWMFTQ